MEEFTRSQATNHVIADEEVSDEAVEVLRQRQNFSQALTQRVLALIGEKFFRR